VRLLKTLLVIVTCPLWLLAGCLISPFMKREDEDEERTHS